VPRESRRETSGSSRSHALSSCPKMTGFRKLKERLGHQAQRQRRSKWSAPALFARPFAAWESIRWALRLEVRSRSLRLAHATPALAACGAVRRPTVSVISNCKRADIEPLDPVVRGVELRLLAGRAHQGAAVGYRMSCGLITRGCLMSCGLLLPERSCGLFGLM
jgi:hypothetical protein